MILQNTLLKDFFNFFTTRQHCLSGFLEMSAFPDPITLVSHIRPRDEDKKATLSESIVGTT